MFGDTSDERLPPMERAVGVSVGNRAVAVVRSNVAEAGVMPITVDGRRLLVWHTGGQTSALDSSSISDGREVGSVNVVNPVINGQRLDFTDVQTGSTWNLLGQATAGPLKGSRLDTFWSAWVAFQPDTRIHN